MSKPDSVFSSSTAEIPPCSLLASMWEVNMSGVPLTAVVLAPVAKGGGTLGFRAAGVKLPER